MGALRDLDPERHLADPALRRSLIGPVFDLVAPRYDDFTRLFSFGRDATWKAELVRLALGHAGAVREGLDLACGTGDLAFAVAHAVPSARLRGIDASPEMLGFAGIRARAAPPLVAARVAFQEGDLGALPAEAGSVDLVTAGYAFRNAIAWQPALAEAARVLRPGGVLGVLDFYRPALSAWSAVFLGYLRAAGGAVGWWWHGEPLAYGYIAHSVAAYVTAGAFAGALRDAGFDVLAERRRLGGGIAIHVARRRA